MVRVCVYCFTSFFLDCCCCHCTTVSASQLYQFGYTVSIPLFEGEWRPDSFYSRIGYNARGGMHSLCLLDIKMKEPDHEAMCMGKVRFLPPRFMTVSGRDRARDWSCCDQVVFRLLPLSTDGSVSAARLWLLVCLCLCVLKVNTAVAQLLEVEAKLGEV